MTVIHIASLKRMEQLFCLGGLSSVLFQNETKTCKYSTCAKLHVEIDRQEMNAYAIQGNQRDLTVQLENNQIIQVRCPKWDQVHFEY